MEIFAFQMLEDESFCRNEVKNPAWKAGEGLSENEFLRFN